jgi:hypothetical protein
LAAKEEALKKLQANVQETKKSPYIITMKSSTMTDSSMVKSPSKALPQGTFGDFEKHTRGIDSNIMRQMGYDDEGLGKEGQGVLIPIVDQ